MAEHALDITVFRAAYPAFTDPTAFPNAAIQAQWDAGSSAFFGVYDGCLLYGGQLQTALNLLTAHLLYIGDLIAKGVSPAILTQAKIDKVQVTAEPPRSRSAWAYWLNLSPYGQQLLALLAVAGAGGFYIGGSAVRSGFRGPAGGRFGRFGPGWV